jgi:hypothetical protein
MPNPSNALAIIAPRSAQMEMLAKNRCDFAGQFCIHSRKLPDNRRSGNPESLLLKVIG